MKKSPKKLLCMSLCLILWFNLFASIQSRFVFAQPIEVFFTDPSNGNIITPNENGNVLIRAEYTGSECPYYMDFYIDGVREAHIRSYSPCTTSGFFYWNTLEYGDGWYDLYACVTYEGGTVIAESETFEVYLDNPERPQIEIIKPSNNEIVGGPVDIETKVTVDPDWVYDTKVKFLVDGNIIDWVFNPTGEEEYYIFYYTLYNWDSTSVPDGQHTISAKVYDDFGRTEEDSIAVVVQQSPDNPPTVEITYPYDGKTVDGTERIKISASDDVGISKVELKIDNQLVQTFFSEPYEYYWDTTAYSDGEHTIEAFAYDASNQWDYHSVNVRVNNSDSAPTVSITNPQNGDIVAGTIRIDVTASDDVGVTKVEFYIDNNLLSTDKSAPYLDWWNTKTYLDGPHTIKVIAYDTKYNTNFDEISVNVQNGISNRPPTACFTYEEDPNDVRRVNFDATCSRDPDGDISSYFWDFGDGETGQGEKIAHRYSNPGIYKVTLVVEDKKGYYSITDETIEIKSIYTQISVEIYPIKSAIQPNEQIQLNVRVDNAGSPADNLEVILEILDENLQLVRKEGFVNPREEAIPSMGTGTRIIYFWFDHNLDIGKYYAYVKIKNANNIVLDQDKKKIRILGLLTNELKDLEDEAMRILFDPNDGRRPFEPRSIVGYYSYIASKWAWWNVKLDKSNDIERIKEMLGIAEITFSVFYELLEKVLQYSGELLTLVLENTFYHHDAFDENNVLYVQELVRRNEKRIFSDLKGNPKYFSEINSEIESRIKNIGTKINNSNLTQDEIKEIREIIIFSKDQIQSIPRTWPGLYSKRNLYTLKNNIEALEYYSQGDLKLNSTFDTILFGGTLLSIVVCPSPTTIAFFFVGKTSKHEAVILNNKNHQQEFNLIALLTNNTTVESQKLILEILENVENAVDNIANEEEIPEVTFEDFYIPNEVKLGDNIHHARIRLYTNEPCRYRIILHFYKRSDGSLYQSIERVFDDLSPSGENIPDLFPEEPIVVPPGTYRVRIFGHVDGYLNTIQKIHDGNITVQRPNVAHEVLMVMIKIRDYLTYSLWSGVVEAGVANIDDYTFKLAQMRTNPQFEGVFWNIVDAPIYSPDGPLGPNESFFHSESISQFRIFDDYFEGPKNSSASSIFYVYGIPVSHKKSNTLIIDLPLPPLPSNGINSRSISTFVKNTFSWFLQSNIIFVKNTFSWFLQSDVTKSFNAPGPIKDGDILSLFFERGSYDPCEDVNFTVEIWNSGNVALDNTNSTLTYSVYNEENLILEEGTIDSWSVDPQANLWINGDFSTDSRFTDKFYYFKIVLSGEDMEKKVLTTLFEMTSKKEMHANIKCTPRSLPFNNDANFNITFNDPDDNCLEVTTASLNIIYPDGQQSKVSLDFNQNINEYAGTFKAPEQNGTYIAIIDGGKDGYKDVSESIAFAVGAMSKLVVDSVVSIAENNATINVTVSNENGIPIDQNVFFLTVILKTPLGKKIFVPMNLISTGNYQGSFVMDKSGNYEISVVAEGYMFDSGMDVMNINTSNPIQSTQEEKMDSTEIMISLALTRIRDAESLQEEVNKLLEQVKEKELDTSICELIIEEALSLLGKAKNLYAGGNYIAANNYALQAIEKFKEAIKCLEELLRK